MIDLSQLGHAPDAVAPGFEGKWHAIEFQPELHVPQFFVIGVALSRGGKLVQFRIAEEAARLQCFYGDRFSRDTWGWLRNELAADLTDAKSSTWSRYVSASPQIRIGEGHYVSGSDAMAVLSRTFERVVTVTASDRKPRKQGITQFALRARMAQLMKLRLDTRYEEISQPEGGLQIRDGERFHTFDITYDDTETASSVVSACYLDLNKACLNVLGAAADLDMFHRVRPRKQIGLAVLVPSATLLPRANVQNWERWWDNFSFKLRESNLVLLAESEQPEELAEKVQDWYVDAQPD
ncbi:hypothetical protein [Paracidovorax wautersii]|uniref:hypothetical protein n=1 Tax=Paracidovorax wautersii TaxID=1177982 RepID=UPI0031D3ADCC